MKKKSSGKGIFKKVIVILSGISFFWFSASTVIGMLTNPQPAPSAVENPPVNNELVQEIEGYQLVLEKEPDNRFAREKIVEIHLQNKDLKSALPHMEKLVALQPENQQYQEILSIIKQGIESEKSQDNSQE